MIRSNLDGPFFCCQQFIRRLDGSDRHGSIINITRVHQEIPGQALRGLDRRVAVVGKGDQLHSRATANG